MKGIILAAGRGARLKHLTDAKPKCLVEHQGKPLLEWQVDALTQAGVDEIAIVTGYRREMLISRAATEFHNPDWAKTNMVSSLACACKWLQAEPCIVSYSDIFFESEAIKHLIASASDIALTYDVNWRQLWEARFGNPMIDAETFRLDQKSNLLEIGTPPQSADDIEGQYMGLLYFSPEGWSEVERVRNALPSEQRASIQMTQILNKVIRAARIPVHAIPYSGDWGEVDTEEDLNLYEQRK